jgi:hypothetical protein
MKHADLVSLIAAGAVDSIDQLTAMVQTEHVDRVKKGKKTRHLSPQGAPALVPGAEALGPLPARGAAGSGTHERQEALV